MSTHCHLIILAIVNINIGLVHTTVGFNTCKILIALFHVAKLQKCKLDNYDIDHTSSGFTCWKVHLVNSHGTILIIFHIN